MQKREGAVTRGKRLAFFAGSLTPSQPTRARDRPESKATSVASGRDRQHRLGPTSSHRCAGARRAKEETIVCNCCARRGGDRRKTTTQADRDDQEIRVGACRLGPKGTNNHRAVSRSRLEHRRTIQGLDGCDICQSTKHATVISPFHIVRRPLFLAHSPKQHCVELP